MIGPAVKTTNPTIRRETREQPASPAGARDDLRRADRNRLAAAVEVVAISRCCRVERVLGLRLRLGQRFGRFLLTGQDPVDGVLPGGLELGTRPGARQRNAASCASSTA